MTKLIRLSDDVILELDKNKGNKSYSVVIRELIVNSNSKHTVNYDNKLDTILNKLQLIIELISSKSNY